MQCVDQLQDSKIWKIRADDCLSLRCHTLAQETPEKFRSILVNDAGKSS